MIPAIVPTPLDAGRELPPEPARGGLEPALLDAMLVPPGAPDLASPLRDPNVLAVTTGQQPGLLTGPLYTIHKALSAAALAGHLAERWERPVVPVFWLAGDDHDFAEANHASWLDPEGRVRTAILRERAPEAPLVPMYREPLGTDMDRVLDRLAADLPPTEFREETLAWLRRHYRPEATVAGAFGHALAELLAPFGIVCFDSTHPAAKRAMARHIARALGLAQDLQADLAARDRDLKAVGHDAGVGVSGDATLVMLEAGQGRDRLMLDGNTFVTRRSGERFSRAELESLLAESPERFSGNVLLRPVLESAILPTAAYVAGPGELRYLTLTAPVYDRLRIPKQTPVARWSGLLVPSRVDRALAKFDATLDDLLADDHALEARIARSHLPPEAVEALARVRETLNREYARLDEITAGIDPTMQEPVRKARRHGLSEADRLEQRLVQHQKARHDVELDQVTRARTVVRPLGKPQERVLGVAPFLARYGPALLEGLSGSIREWYAAALVGDASPS